MTDSTGFQVAFSAGAAKADITPGAPVVNWVDAKPYDGVLDPIAVRALVLGDGRTSVAFVCWDLIDATSEAVSQIRQAVREATGIPRAHILVAASHTHSAPRSPFPHTLVVGYANGRGMGYVGLPGEKARGGYEAGAGQGTDECGLFMIETAVRLLKELREDAMG